jgi:hypothetical protein
MSKGVSAFREEIKEGAALVKEEDLFEPTLDSDLRWRTHTFQISCLSILIPSSLLVG